MQRWKQALLGAALCGVVTTPNVAVAQDEAARPVAMYKPSSRSPAAISILSPEYGAHRSAPNALKLGAVAPDFRVPRAGGGEISLRKALRTGPVAIIFYRGHW